MPTNARELAARLSAPFGRDAWDRLAAQRRPPWLWSGLAPDAFGLVYDGAAAAAIGTSPIAALIRDAGLAANSPDARGDAAGSAGRSIARSAPTKTASEQRRQLAVEVRECSQQLTQALCTAGWSAHEAQHVNVHELAKAAGA
jgi:hypothetical protein